MSDYEYYRCPCGRNHPTGVICAIGRQQLQNIPSDDEIKSEAKERAKTGGPLIMLNHDPSLRKLIETEYAYGFEAGARWMRSRF